MLKRWCLTLAVVVTGFVALVPTMPVQAEVPSARSFASSKIEKSGDVWFDDFQQGWQESKRSGLPMLVYITSDRCIYCDAMKRDTWGDEVVMQRLRQEFVPIRLHRDRDSNVLSRIRVPAFPTTLLATPQGKVVSHRVGYQPASEIHRLLSETRQAARAVRR